MFKEGKLENRGKKQKKKRRRDEIVIDCIALIDNRAKKLIVIYRGTGTATNCLNR